MDMVHVIGAGAWLGGLAYLSLLAIPAAMKQPAEIRAVTLAGVLRAFTKVALGGAAALIASGLYAAWIHVGSISALLGSDYGRVLLLKLALIAAMAVLGALNWRLFGVQTDHAGVLGVMILLATAVLVALPTPASGV
jgi:putative copper export protein